ncbi:MAG TPA: hypothetical protein PLK30_06095, partial [Blastocatellia bacterium]|nr:hypothetical protein [Blastocatellia bacterium]
MIVRLLFVALLIAASVVPALRNAQEPQSSTKPTTFSEVPASKSGISWIHDNGRSDARHLPETCGGGGLF